MADRAVADRAVADRAAAGRAPVGELDAAYSSDGAEAAPWSVIEGKLDLAKVYWLSTVRPGGRPHVTPIAGIWLDGAFTFTTGEHERKADNLSFDQNVVVTTGSNVLEGLDVVVEGVAVRLTDDARLGQVADAYRDKYGTLFDFEVSDGSLHSGEPADAALTFEVRPDTVFAFGKGLTFSQTRFRF